MKTKVTTVKLNRTGFDFATRLVDAGKVVHDDRDMWSEHEPTAEEENAFIEQFGFTEYSRWHLGIDTGAPENTKGHYKFPYGDFIKVHRCGVLAAEVRAAQRKYEDIQAAAVHLHGMIDSSTKT
jgi:hypothetical protein